MTNREQTYRQGAFMAMRLARQLCREVYGDRVQVLGREEPLAVGRKLSVAIARAVDLKLRERDGGGE